MANRNKCLTLFCHINTRIALTILDILIGISNILSYIFQFHNWSAMSLTVVVTLVACQTLCMFLAEKRKRIWSWSSRLLWWIMLTDIILGFLALFTFIACFIIAGIRNIQFTNLYGENLWFTGLWATAIVKYAWQNAFLAKNYERQKENFLKNQIIDY